MLIEINIRDGEAHLLERIFKNDSLPEVILDARRRDLIFEELRVDHVTKEGPWVSAKESTIPLAVIYLKSETEGNYVIVKRSEEEGYGLFKYRWVR